VLNELLAQRTNPSKIKYSIYLLDDKEMVNAFTAGGKIFVTKAIIAQCKNDDQLYGIIGHEIAHNEKGHIKKSIQELKASRAVLGDYSETYMELKQIAGGVFNQRAEVEADYYGLGLVYTLGRNPCSLISFWHEMETKEGQYNKLEDFLRSHPYSAQRAECMRRHIAQNFRQNCP
jgi:predicted Zn-dependent protease